MSSNEDVMKLQKYVKKAPSDSSYQGHCRRAIAMIPAACDPREVLVTDASKYRRLLAFIEGNQSTCVLKIVSSIRKSRSAILIFRGRVLGCIHGNKQLSQQLFGMKAYEHILTGLVRDSLIEAYFLPEGLALAAGSLFHSALVDTHGGIASPKIFASVYDQIVQAGKPGCIVINDQNDLPVVSVYLFKRSIIGVYPHNNRWDNGTYETALRYLSATNHPKISASMLSANNMQEVEPLTFGLSRLEDHKSEPSPESEAFNLNGLLIPIKPIDRLPPPPISQFVPAASQSKLNRSRKNFTECW